MNLTGSNLQEIDVASYGGIVIYLNKLYICLRTAASICSAVNCPGNLCKFGLKIEYALKLPSALCEKPTMAIKAKHEQTISGGPRSYCAAILARIIHAIILNHILHPILMINASIGSGIRNVSLKKNTIVF